MDLQLYNTLTRRKEPFRPLDPANVRMYVCGPTVYDFAHIGNARPAIVFDVLYRLLRHVYGPEHVTYVRNITDVDDKINARALRDFGAQIAAGRLTLNEAIRKVTEPTYEQYQTDVTALGCLPPTHQPRATEHIDGMIAMAQQLLDRGHAYLAEGDEGREVLFDVASMPDYGRLSNRRLEEQQAGARIEVKDHKRNPGDFVLWKESSDQEPGWPAHFHVGGAHADIFGRPGWHLECSVMSEAFLGREFDIHGGGLDLIFPHHENEIAQSRCAHGSETMARVWMHNGFLQVEGEKMSKSLGNFVVSRQLLQRVAGSVLRFNMLKTQYREPINWTEVSLQESRAELLEWSEWISAFPPPVASAAGIDNEVLESLLDDLNTPRVITRLRYLFKQTRSDPYKYLAPFMSSMRFLGFDDIGQKGHFRAGMGYWIPKGKEAAAERANHLAIFARAAIANKLPEAGSILEEIRRTGASYRLTKDGDIEISISEKSSEELIEEQILARSAARNAKNFAEADRIRDELAAMGVVLKDSKDPQTGEQKTTWEIAR
jgi:cysteinyl-tRNA synthetase